MTESQEQNSHHLLLLKEMIQQQQALLLRCALRIVPTVTADDLMQPNDFPELENHPVFRYEEGLLAGLQSALMALKVEASKGS
jgi:hypothetical protein